MNAKCDSCAFLWVAVMEHRDSRDKLICPKCGAQNVSEAST